jgi:hypothetical protein
MNDSTTTTNASGAPEAVAADRRTARRLALSQQQHRDADAELERRRKAALQELELREARAEAARRKREWRRRQVQARRNARKARRTARRARVRAAVPRWAERALFIGPILFPMAVAWIGQMQYARTIMGWPLAGAIVFAAGFELSTVYVARLDWKARGEGDNSIVFRAATWMFAALAATMNYWHAAEPGFRPNGEAVSYGAMSIAGIMLWELLSTYRHRSKLRAAGKLPPRRPRFGLARWVWFPRVTHLARLLALRDGHTQTEQAWRAALDEAHRHGSVRAAVASLRGRGSFGLANGETPAATPAETPATTAEPPAQTTVKTSAATTVKTATATSAKTPAPTPGETTGKTVGEIPAETAGEIPAETVAETGAETAGETPAKTTTVSLAETGPGGGAGVNGHRPSRNGKKSAGRGSGVKDKMIRYVAAQRRAGRPVTGADLDRRFGTVNYGSRVLRDWQAQRG